VFSRSSRYSRLPDTVDESRADGRTVTAKSLRPLPDTPATFQHTIAEGDRLDNLANRYYQQPQKWWRICDANPEILSPLDLLGRGALRTVRIPLDVAAAGESARADLAAGLGAEPGVERFWFEEVAEVVTRVVPGDDGPLTVGDERRRLAVVVSYNRLVVVAARLVELASAAGLSPRQPEALGRVGKRIAVPPDVVG